MFPWFAVYSCILKTFDSTFYLHSALSDNFLENLTKYNLKSLTLL